MFCTRMFLAYRNKLHFGTSGSVGLGISGIMGFGSSGSVGFGITGSVGFGISGSVGLGRSGTSKRLRASAKRFPPPVDTKVTNNNIMMNELPL
ncbi:hypothetical protein HanPSC8_Chr02g0071661 [Helianthus annuus]|nr:hypothetical protein HanPSC8_Chr02g0071661 [Helianthus annuus]